MPSGLFSFFIVAVALKNMVQPCWFTGKQADDIIKTQPGIWREPVL